MRRNPIYLALDSNFGPTTMVPGTGMKARKNRIRVYEVRSSYRRFVSTIYLVEGLYFIVTKL